MDWDFEARYWPKAKYGTGTASDGLGAIIPPASLHVSRVAGDFDGDKVVAYLNSGFAADLTISSEELVVRSGNYRTYKLTVQAEVFDHLLHFPV